MFSNRVFLQGILITIFYCLWAPLAEKNAPNRGRRNFAIDWFPELILIKTIVECFRRAVIAFGRKLQVGTVNKYFLLILMRPKSRERKFVFSIWDFIFKIPKKLCWRICGILSKHVKTESHVSIRSQTFSDNVTRIDNTNNKQTETN